MFATIAFINAFGFSATRGTGGLRPAYASTAHVSTAVMDVVWKHCLIYGPLNAARFLV